MDNTNIIDILDSSGDEYENRTSSDIKSIQSVEREPPTDTEYILSHNDIKSIIASNKYLVQLTRDLSARNKALEKKLILMAKKYESLSEGSTQSNLTLADELSQLKTTIKHLEMKINRLQEAKVSQLVIPETIDLDLSDLDLNESDEV